MLKAKTTFAVLVLAGLMIFMTAFSSAQSLSGQSEPSHWAVQEVTEAIGKGLVPKELQANYQSNIKRYQYVLLALEVYEKTGKNVDIVDTRPFADVSNHDYEQEIVKAYNAGLVKGDGKGNFFPDDFITRQEIASLIVNLLMQIAPEKDFSVRNSYQYSDSDEISDWARFYIDYCFENKILAGYGNNMIDPKGNATVEQSIVLLYRLAMNEGLLESLEKQEKVNIEELSIETINNFTDEYSAETFSIIKNVVEDEEVELTSFWDKSATIYFKYNSISLNSPAFEKNIYALVHDINEEIFAETYKKLLLNNFSGGGKGVLLFEQNIEKMKSKELIDVYEEIDDTQIFLIESRQDNNNNISYLIGFIQKKK